MLDSPRYVTRPVACGVSAAAESRSPCWGREFGGSSDEKTDRRMRRRWRCAHRPPAAAGRGSRTADAAGSVQRPPAYVIFTWTGFYFGAHAGGGWGRTGNRAGLPVSISSGLASSPDVRSCDPSGWHCRRRRSAPSTRPAPGSSARRRMQAAPNLTGNGSCPSSRSLLPVPSLTGNCDVKVVEASAPSRVKLGVAFDRAPRLRQGRRRLGQRQDS